jgi:hypothetical protein
VALRAILGSCHVREYLSHVLVIVLVGNRWCAEADGKIKARS